MPLKIRFLRQPPLLALRQADFAIHAAFAYFG
jgi:hypothetical protein